jgi:hypothetical protein
MAGYGWVQDRAVVGSTEGILAGVFNTSLGVCLIRGSPEKFYMLIRGSPEKYMWLMRGSLGIFCVVNVGFARKIYCVG